MKNLQGVFAAWLCVQCSVCGALQPPWALQHQVCSWSSLKMQACNQKLAAAGTPTKRRNVSSILLKHGNSGFLVDAGEGTCTQVSPSGFLQCADPPETVSGSRHFCQSCHSAGRLPRKLPQEHSVPFKSHHDLLACASLPVEGSCNTGPAKVCLHPAPQLLVGYDCDHGAVALPHVCGVQPFV